ncbi:MAG: nucleoside deaminase [Candidatus Paceibacterota bacterium]|jgi:tRNA(Arg) A34 adenosine deaminase TadA
MSYTTAVKKKKMDDSEFMGIAINKAKQGIKNGQNPFGACIVKNRKIIICAHNKVRRNKDITSHAEICAIRGACRKLKTVDLSGCVIYSTCEPCPMCFSACHWAKISKIVFGMRIEDSKRYGFDELTISNKKMKIVGGSPIKITGNIMRNESLELFKFLSKGKNLVK